MAYNRQFKIIKDFGQLMGQYTVEDGVKKLIISGTASGASTQAVTGHAWATSRRQVIAASPSFEHVVGMQDNGGTSIWPQRLDWVGARSNNWADSVIASNAVGYSGLFADNGFGIAYGALATGRYTTDGKTWASVGTINFGNAERRVALNASSLNRTSPLTSVRCVGVDGSTGLMVWNGSAFASTTYASHVLTSVHFANAHFLANNNQTAGQTKLKYATEAAASAATGWGDITVDGSAQNQINDIHYSTRLGMYLTACNGGKIYTQAAAAGVAPTGAWTSRTSGTADNIVGIKESSTHVVMVTSTGKVLYSTDGINWSVTAAVVGAMVNRDAIGYITVPGTLPTNGTVVWCLVRNDTTGSRIYTSTDLATWTVSPNTESFNAILAAPNGLIGLRVDSAATFRNLPDPRTATMETYTVSTFDGSDAIVKAMTSGALYRLKGATANRGGNSESVQMSFAGGAIGLGGQSLPSASTNSVPVSGTAGPSNSGTASGGGGSILFTELARNEGVWGIKIPGSNGSPNTAGGGGGSIMGVGGGTGNPGLGWGAGAAGNTGAGGGAGEGVWRAELTVTPGEIIVYTGGSVAHESTTSAHLMPNNGNIRIEVEA